ncbi:hypothetical protein ACVWYH_002780 [Bradyrhizobium sp. GM24.11]
MGVLSWTFVISAFFCLHNEQSQVVSSLISDASLNVTAPQWQMLDRSACWSFFSMRSSIIGDELSAQQSNCTQNNVW